MSAAATCQHDAYGPLCSRCVAAKMQRVAAGPRCEHDRDPLFCVWCNTTPEERAEYARTGGIGRSGQGKRFVHGDEHWETKKEGSR